MLFMILDLGFRGVPYNSTYVSTNIFTLLADVIINTLTVNYVNFYVDFYCLHFYTFSALSVFVSIMTNLNYKLCNLWLFSSWTFKITHLLDFDF